MSARKVDVEVQSWPIEGAFVISRGARREAIVVVATVREGAISGRGECVPYARYGETVEAVRDKILGIDSASLNRRALTATLPPGAARNAIDCALWDLDAKRSGTTVAAILRLLTPRPLLTCYTLSLETPAAMAARAKSVHHLPLLKLKLGGGAVDADRMRAVRAARPDARLVADANEAWAPSDLSALLAVAKETGMEVIEQPLPAASDAILADIPHAVPICADESVHASSDLDAIATRYDAVNIKLDKTGGLTEALLARARARALGLKVMVGCMVSTSLAMAPAFLLGQDADWIDLDGPLLLSRDRSPGITYRDGLMSLPPNGLWG